MSTTINSEQISYILRHSPSVLEYARFTAYNPTGFEPCLAIIADPAGDSPTTLTYKLGQAMEALEITDESPVTYDDYEELDQCFEKSVVTGVALETIVYFPDITVVGSLDGDLS